ncbi:M24 family metallopeptidase [Paenibacillus arenilitoris]|uniref:Aminopeptidase P family protein n=1 Tax=Paenibacillus arenilitoris TaxID=2772299 RepID=A0A927CM58_9BACL|nr:M24 family metallopeptidase [Paenibacillus arenilitoris]MBD2870643.1 aminopeptidase P family protein [Paenibacillus arenilitoris]
MKHFSDYLYVQSIAKSSMKELGTFIKEGITEREIVMKAEDILRQKGVERFWYYNIGAFVHVGTRTNISESGRDYRPSEQKVGKNDIVTVDLSPEINAFWGDYARTFIVIEGSAVDEIQLQCQHNSFADEFGHGLHTEKQLRRLFKAYVEPEKTFEEVYLHMNRAIQQLGYVNLDFAGNLGHTIEFHKEERSYFERGNTRKIGEAAFFTFEPHIKHANGAYGFKREDIYYFRNGELKVL